MASTTTKIVKALEEQGWTVTKGQNHYRCVPAQKDKAIVFIASTPGGGNRSIENAIAQLRRSGFVWPWPPDKQGGK